MKIIFAFMLFLTGGATMAYTSQMVHVYDAVEKRYKDVERIEKTPEEWKLQLTPLQYNVIREHGTELAFAGEYYRNKHKGIYRCIGCGLDLFSSEHKFESRTGWPSFWQPIDPANIGSQEDKSYFMERTEVHCPRCGGHLGHVFDDGPAPTGKRYCINSIALKFIPHEAYGK